MLSNPPQMSALHSRHRQHRRQNSTPSAFDAVKIAPLPDLRQRRPTSHRRGLSLDIRGQHPQPLAPAPPTATRQEYVATTMTTNPGPTIKPQHVLRESQQQRTIRSGHSQPAFTEQNNSDIFLLSPQVTPQTHLYPSSLPGQGQLTDVSGLPFEPYPSSLGLFDRAAANLNGNGIDPPQEFEFFTADSALSTPTFMTFPESSPAETGQGWISESETASTHSRRSSRRISNGILDKVAKFEAMRNGQETLPQRPCTPDGQTSNAFFPQTPVEVKQESTPFQPPNRFLDGYDESMEETLKPVRNKNSNRASGIFQDLRQQAESMVHTPPRANTIPMAITNPGLRTPEFMNMRNISAEFRKIEREFGSIPTSPVNIPDMFSLMKVPNAFENKPDLPPFDEQNMAPVGASSPVSQTPSRRASPHRRTESIASITSAASIADINIEETKTDTGVTLDDIAAFIQGPDPSDGKWRCLYEGCNKPFGRKENIKSHVQTHLNDRQYQCPTCKKCFVRQHDLKRHAKIHTGIKPYPCECGNSFARHDALTRHRQRGMCIGAFDGVVRKVVKRGRPKKIRPDMDERRDKAERTRRKNKVTSANSASSQSGYSDISAANSPSNDFDGLLDDDHFPSFTLPPATIHPTTLAVSTAPIPTTGTTATTSMATIYRSISPSAMSNYSQTSTSNHPNPTLPPLPRHQASAATSTSTADFSDIHNNNSSNSPPSPTKSVASHYTHHAATTPPDLSSPRSPPPLASSGGSGGSASARWVDLDPGNASDLSDVSIGLGTTVAAHAAASAAGAGTGAAGAAGNAFHGAGGLEAYQHDSMLLGFHVGEELVGLEGIQMLGGGGNGGMGSVVGGVKFEKFDDEFDPVSMFTNGEDVFFGTA